MGDFLPGYVMTFANASFNSSNANLILVGKENGKIYGRFQSKDDFFHILSTKSFNNTKMCYYNSSITFTKEELKSLSDKRILLVNDAQLEKIRIAFTETMRFA